jgi:hypothetical protein
MQLGFLSDALNFEVLASNPVFWLFAVFSLWMFVDAIRRGEWIWAVFIFIFPMLNAVLYFFLVFRNAASATRGFELPGAWNRKRIRELETQIHHLDKAHHHLELGDIRFQQGKLAQAEASYRAALERDGEDPDIRAHLGQCLLRLKRPAEARPLLEQVIATHPKHDYGHTLMALAETQAALGERDASVATWRRVLESHSYARARVQLADLLLESGAKDETRALLMEVVEDHAHAPEFQRKQERVWVKRAKRLLR